MARLTGHVTAFYIYCKNVAPIPPANVGVVYSTTSSGSYSYDYDDISPDGWPGKTMGPSCNCAGDPITLGTGNEYRDELDADLGDLSLHRYYNSDIAVASANIGASWRHSFDRSLSYTSVGGTSATVYRPDGRVVMFRLKNSQWTADRDVQDKLVSNTSGWTFFEASTRQHEIYDSSGKLVAIQDVNGLVTTLDYSTTNTPVIVAPMSGLLLTVTDPKGRSLSFAYATGVYGGSARISKVTLPDGGIISYGYADGDSQLTNNLTQVTYPGGGIMKYQYVLSQADTPWPNALTGVVDEKGVLYSEISYDSQGRAIASRLAGGAEVTSVTYNSDNTTSVQYPSGATTTLTFAVMNSDIRTTASSSPCGSGCFQPNALATYDANGYVASTIDHNGNARVITHDANGLLLRSIESNGSADQRTTDTMWDTTLRAPLLRTVEDSAGKILSQESWAYNAVGQTTAACRIDAAIESSYVCSASGVAPLGVRRTVNTYCTAIDATTCPLTGLLLTIDGPRTDVTDTVSYAYYLTTDESACAALGGACHHLGDLKSTTDGAGLVTTFVSYDKAGRPTRVRNPNGILTDYTYSPRGWLATKIVRADTSGIPSSADAVTTIVYDPTGTVHSVRDPDGVTTTYTYDAAHRLTDITDANGARIHYTLDAAGNRTNEQVLTSTGTVTRSLGRTFNSLGQLTALADGLNRTVFAAGFADSYDGNGNLVHSQDGLSVQQKQSYDGLNRLVSTIRDYQGINSATANTQSVTSFDALDRVTGFSDPDGLNTTYDIDAFGNITGLHSPDTGTTTKTYDVVGNLISTVDANQVTTAFTYDALGRPTGTTYPDTTLNVAYQYDESDSVTGCTGGFSKGHLTRVVESNGGIVYCYDGHGNVIKKQQTVEAVTTTTSYAWTLGDRLKSITTANGTVVAYSRDANGRITTVTATPLGGATTTIASNVAYQPFGSIASYTLGNGQTVTRTYDANGQLTDIASAAFSLHMGRDAMGNVAALGDSVGASPASETYGYDSLYRLTGVNGSSGNSIEAYTYNKTGDRLSKAAPGLLTGAYSYQPGTHRLVAVGTTMRQVDARGNTTANVLPGGTFGYGYNQRNRLTVVQKDGVTVGSYVLNALGQRVQKTVGGTSTRFDYDEASQLLSEITGGTARDYVWLDNLPIGIVDRSGSTMAIGFIHADGLGSPRAVTDDAGAVQWKWTFASNPFGENIPVPTSGYTLNLRFPGQYFDTESGLNYNINRNYEAASGRYLQSDPLGIFSGQANTYAYVQNNPLRGIDPLGLAECGQGHWVQVGSDMLNLDAIGVLGSLISNNVCRCVWLWVNTTGPYMWSGDLNDSTLTRTRGVPVGMSGDPSLEHEFGKGQSLTPSPSSCICSPPPPKG